MFVSTQQQQQQQPHCMTGWVHIRGHANSSASKHSLLLGFFSCCMHVHCAPGAMAAAFSSTGSGKSQ
jgi:hypothetical protein